jgi:MFS family permease
MVSTLASVLSNLILGRLGDRYGNRLLVRLAALTAVLPPAAALLLAYVSGPTLDRSVLFTLVFVLQGLHATAHAIGSSNYLLELGPAAERVTYVSFAHGVIGLAVLASPLGGAVVDWMGFESLFALSLACGLVAAGLSMGLGEPREAQTAG